MSSEWALPEAFTIIFHKEQGKNVVFNVFQNAVMQQTVFYQEVLLNVMCTLYLKWSVWVFLSCVSVFIIKGHIFIEIILTSVNISNIRHNSKFKII